MSFLLYLVGFIVVIAGLAWVFTMAGLPQGYILAGAGVLLLVGLGTALARMREPAS